MTSSNTVHPDHLPGPLRLIHYDGLMMHELSHQHEAAQMMYCRSGTFELVVKDQVFLVPPTHAVWIPSNELHRGQSRGEIQFRSLYFDVPYVTRLPNSCLVLRVNPFLRALIDKLFSMGQAVIPNTPQQRLAEVLIDEINGAQRQPYGVSLPEHPKLLQIYRVLSDTESAFKNSEDIARYFAMSSKTLNRLCASQTGMTFGHWHQRIKLNLAIALLATGSSTTYVAQTLHYSNDSAFIAMFKRLTGETPSAFRQISTS